LDLVFEIAPISNHVAKFRGDWPRDRGDLALKKKETAAKRKSRRLARCVIATGGPKNVEVHQNVNNIFFVLHEC